MSSGDIFQVTSRKPIRPRSSPNSEEAHGEPYHHFFKATGGVLLLLTWLASVSAMVQPPSAPSTAPGAVAQGTPAKESGTPAAQEASPTASPTTTLPFFISSTKRDPFKSPLDRAKSEKQPEVETIDVPPPRNRRPQGPPGWLISEVRLLGIVQGMGTKVAMLSSSGTITYFMHEGERLFDGYIREISDNYIKFVREIKSKNIVIRQQEVTVSVQPTP